MVILLLALLVLGPDKLPEYARKAGNYFHEFRRMTSGFEEEFRQAMDLSDLTGASNADSPAAKAPAAEGDALDRATEGPRLLPRVEPTAPALPEPPPSPATEAPATAVETPGSTGPAGFAADITPAPGTGPELITPKRPTADHEGDPGSSSAA